MQGNQLKLIVTSSAKRTNGPTQSEINQKNIKSLPVSVIRVKYV